MAFWQRKWKKATAFTTRGPIYNLLVFSNFLYYLYNNENSTYFQHVVYWNFAIISNHWWHSAKKVEKTTAFTTREPYLQPVGFHEFYYLFKKSTKSAIHLTKVFSRFLCESKFLMAFWKVEKTPTHSREAPIYNTLIFISAKYISWFKTV